MSLAHRAAAGMLAALVASLPTRQALAQDGADTLPPVIAFVPCEVFQKDRPFTVTARFADESALFEPKLTYRAAAEKVWKRAPFVRDGEVWRATIAKGELTGAIEYFVEVFDENGNGPSRVGSPEAPLFARVARRAPECPVPGAIASPVVTVQEASTTLPASAVTHTQGKRTLLAGCEAGAPSPPFYCKRWVWYATAGAVLATIGIVVLASSGDSRDYPDRVDFQIRSQGLEHDTP